MAAAGEEVCCHGILQAVATLFQQRHIPGQGGGIAGDIHNAAGGESRQSFNG